MQRAEALVAAVVVVVVVVEDYRPMGFTPLKKLQRAAGFVVAARLKCCRDLLQAPARSSVTSLRSQSWEKAQKVCF